MQCVNSVNHPQQIITNSLYDFYSINSEKVKKIYTDRYNRFITTLEKLKNDFFTEQNIMRNIGNTFKEFSVFYVSLYPYDSIDIIEKIMKITSLLKMKKFRKIDGFINLLVTQIKNFLQVCRKLDDYSI